MYDRRDDAGFTLIELMIAVALLAIIIVPLTGAMVNGLKTTTEAQERLSESRSPLFTSAYFADDAQSADSNGWQIGGSTPACGSGTNVVSFSWIEHVAPPAQYHASYAITPQNKLTRSYCRGDTGTPEVATVAPVLGAAGGSCPTRPACVVKEDEYPDHNPPYLPVPKVLKLIVNTPSGSFTLSATRRAT